MARPTDQETATTEKVVILRSQEKGARYTTQGHVGKCRCWSGGKGVGENVSKSLYCVFPRKELEKQGKQV